MWFCLKMEWLQRKQPPCWLQKVFVAVGVPVTLVFAPQTGTGFIRQERGPQQQFADHFQCRARRVCQRLLEGRPIGIESLRLKMYWAWWLLIALGGVLSSLVVGVWLLRAPIAVPIPLKGRHVLITGGSSGIGLALAQLVVAEGAAKVTLLARRQSNLEEAQTSIEQSSGHRVQILSADVKDYASLAEALASAGAVDVLICSHGLARPETFERSSLESINDQVDTILKGNIHMIKAVLPGMKERAQGGRYPASICMISSQAGQVGVYGLAAYAAAKFGLRGLAESLQQELLPYNIRLSLAFPPDTMTPGYVEENKTKPEVTLLLSQSSKYMEAEDVAKRIVSGLKRGDFFIPCNLDGFALMLATGGLSPHTTLSRGCLEVMLAGVMRGVGMFVLSDWYKVITKWHKKQSK